MGAVPRAISAGERTIDFVLCNDLPTLIWLANLADLELHPSLALADDPDRPTVIAFDLDPGAARRPGGVLRGGRPLRETLSQLGLECYAKTSGSKGMQVYMPLNTPVGYAETKPFAHGVAKLLEAQRPESIVSVMRKTERAGKVFIDWSQNDRHKTTVGPYSLRALDCPTVSTPLTWQEVEEGQVATRAFDAPAVLARLTEVGDPFAAVLTQQQTLPDLG